MSNLKGSIQNGVYIPTLPEALGIIKSLSAELHRVNIEFKALKERDTEAAQKVTTVLATFGRGRTQNGIEEPVIEEVKAPHKKHADHFKSDPSKSRYGCVGVTRTKNGKYWRARFRNVYLGQFIHFGDAVAARKAEESEFLKNR